MLRLIFYLLSIVLCLPDRFTCAYDRGELLANNKTEEAR